MAWLRSYEILNGYNLEVQVNVFQRGICFMDIAYESNRQLSSDMNYIDEQISVQFFAKEKLNMIFIDFCLFNCLKIACYHNSDTP